MFYFLKKKKFERQKQNFGNADANTDANTDADVNMLMSAVPYWPSERRTPSKNNLQKGYKPNCKLFPTLYFSTIYPPRSTL